MLKKRRSGRTLIFIKAILMISIFQSMSLEAFYHKVETLSAVPDVASGTSVNDEQIVRRLIKTYQYRHGQEFRGNSLWTGIFNRQAEISQAFLLGDFKKCANILRNPSASELFYGIDNLTASILPMYSSSTNRQSHAILCLDNLIRFAEALGAVNFYNPEINPPRSSQVMNAATILNIIESALGRPITFPNPYPSEHGLATNRGIVSYRAPQALYQAWRIAELLNDIENPSVLEIGAGVGRTANFARQLGIKDYTIVDLPMTILASGYFLARTVGEDNVVFSGENLENSDGKVKILSPLDFLSGDKQYDLIINVDSFTEMDPHVAQSYWNEIIRRSKIFVSINHEANPFRVRQFIDGTPKEMMQKYYRNAYWMRDGYIEEIIYFK